MAAELTFTVRHHTTRSIHVPVTARLSKRFYERFGDDIVQELVDLLNAVDVSYRTELREQNEMNFARFESKIDQRMAELRAEMQGLKAELIKWMFLFWAGTTLAGLLYR
jgi:hypothetical protein